MKKTLILTTALCGLAFGASAQEVNLLSWGGAYGNSHLEAYAKPFTAETGIAVNIADADNPATPIKAMVEAGNVTSDVASVEYADAVRLCDEGLLEEIDAAGLTAAEDGTAATDDYIEGGVTDCFVATDVYSMVEVYDDSKFADAKPAGPADFFDLEKFPGKRTMRKGAKFNLEFALMADGVPAAEVYDVLGTPEGVDRAFAKLDSIKNDVIWWEAGAQPPQLLADGEVSMAYAFNGRIFDAAMKDGKPFKIVWDGQIMDFQNFAVLKGTPNLEAAKAFLRHATAPDQIAATARYIPYAPWRSSAVRMILDNEPWSEDGKTNVGPFLATNPANMNNYLEMGIDYWQNHQDEVTQRWEAWKAGL